MSDDPLRVFEPGFSDIDDARCECGDLFSDHKKPRDGTPWDICSFPCSKCKCQEFTAAAPLAATQGEALATDALEDVVEFPHIADADTFAAARVQLAALKLAIKRPQGEAAQNAAREIADYVSDGILGMGNEVTETDAAKFLEIIQHHFASAPVAESWLPIETAPKDGTRILVWLPDSENVLSVYWDDRFAYVGNEDGTRQWYEGAWTDDAVKSWAMQEKESYQPTHWQPVPAEPSQSKGEGE